jgi:ribosome-associated heat shock protein Hsp15|tara:strand:- start:1333 stop:1698 length:366 start_codon:yes stop_codon:yes gene_type:complete
MRIDKFIWAVRIFKTRSLASKACTSDKVLLNSEIIKPSKNIKVNDFISVKVIPIWKTYKVKDLPKSRLGPKLLADYIIETTSNNDLELLKKHEINIKDNRTLGIKGRPTKKDRRSINKWLY